MLPQKRNRALEGQALWLVVMAGLAVAAVLVVCRPSVSRGLFGNIGLMAAHSSSVSS